MKLTVRKSLFDLLTATEMKSSGDKITHMGKKRVAAVQGILSEAVLDKRTTVSSVARRLEAGANTPTGTDKRDWKRVAQTEMTAAKGVASLDLLRDLYGLDARVYREVHPKCCEMCAKAYGTASRPKLFAIGKIPELFKGAMHPNCICGPWKSIETPDLTKAMHELAHLPVGMVKKDEGGNILVSTGTYWTELGSTTGRNVTRLVLSHAPLVVLKDQGGITTCSHGWAPQGGRYELLNFLKIGNARYYPMDYAGNREKLMTHVHSWEQYVNKMLQVFPVVATMPNFWKRESGIRYLTDFLGYKTLTDWVVTIPGAVAEKASMGHFSSKKFTMRRKISELTTDQLEYDLRKDT